MTYYQYSASIDTSNSASQTMKCGVEKEWECNAFGYDSNGFIQCETTNHFCNEFTWYPTIAPTIAPSLAPSIAPSSAPSNPSVPPTFEPTAEPTFEPSFEPSGRPTTDPLFGDEGEIVDEIKNYDDESDDDDKDNPINWIWRIILILFGCWAIIISVYCFKKKQKSEMMDTDTKQTTLDPMDKEGLRTEMAIRDRNNSDSDVKIVRNTANKSINDGYGNDNVYNKVPGATDVTIGQDLFESDSDDEQNNKIPGVTPGDPFESNIGDIVNVKPGNDKQQSIIRHVRDTNKNEDNDDDEEAMEVSNDKQQSVAVHVRDTNGEDVNNKRKVKNNKRGNVIAFHVQDTSKDV